MALKSVEITNYRGFPVGQTTIPVPESGPFSPTINLFIGPNGSGKTTLFNAIRLTVCREAHTAGGELTSGHDRLAAGDRGNDFRDKAKPWLARTTFALVDLAATPVATIRQDAPDRDVAYELDDASVSRMGLTPQQAELRNRLFDSGWPRRIPGLASDSSGNPKRAFEPGVGVPDDGSHNDKEYRKSWKWIRDATITHFGWDPGGSPPAFPLPAGSMFGADILDANGKPIIEGSDGQAHMLFLVMEIEKHPWPTTFLIEEPDVYVHPGLQRSFVQYLAARSSSAKGTERPMHQFFVATHSPYIINAVAELLRQTRDPVRKPRIFQMVAGATGIGVADISGNDRQWEAIEAVGHRPSDVLLPNGIIWVEGPSDAVYLKHWLSKYAEEPGKNRTPLVWGRDAEFVWYGGNQWSHMEALGGVWEGMEDADREAVLDVLKVNRNAVVVMDSDDGLEGETGPPKYKKELKRSLEGLTPPRLVWVTGPACLEGYVSATHEKESLCKLFERCRKALEPAAKRKGHRKMDAARAYEDATRSLPLNKIVESKTDIMDRLRELDTEIRKWRGDLQDGAARSLGPG